MKRDRGDGPLARIWPDNTPWEPEPQRPPTVPARPALDSEVPSAVATIRSRLELLGWTVVATYADGWTPGTEPERVESIALRARRGARRALAVWHLGTTPTGRASAKVSVAFLDHRVVTISGWKVMVTEDVAGDEEWAIVAGWHLLDVPRDRKIITAATERARVEREAHLASLGW